MGIRKRAIWFLPAVPFLLVPPAVFLFRADPESDQAIEARLEWWREARFGMFIHWGPASLLGTEISFSRAGQRRGTGGTGEVPVEVYDSLYQQFNPVNFDADEWVRIAQAAGMKYLVFTTKHHDGFVNFDSALTDYKITSPESPFGRDITRELADACRRAGMPIGFYYSQPDWYHPDYQVRPRHKQYIRYLHSQVRELCTQYGPVSILWFDDLGCDPDDWESRKLLRMIRRLQPEAIVNNRSGMPADFQVREQHVGPLQTNPSWETCMTLGTQWAWRPEDELKSAKELIQSLVRAAGGDGNFLLNVGPMPDGRIEPRQAERLREMGDWLRRYGESIYGTRGGPFHWNLPAGPAFCVSTHRGNRIYLHLLDWASESIRLPPIRRKIIGSSVLTGGETQVLQDEDGITITMRSEDRQDVDTIIVLELDGSAADVPVVGLHHGPPISVLRAVASSVRDQREEFAPEKAFDDDRTTRWAADTRDRQPWIELDLGDPEDVSSMAIHEAPGGTMTAFKIQFRNDPHDAWRTIHQGRSLGQHGIIEFEPLMVRYLRIQILEAAGETGLTRIRLFSPPDEQTSSNWCRFP